MEKASMSVVPTLTGVMRLREAATSRSHHYMLVLSCTGGAMEVLENVPAGEGHEAQRRLHHAHDPRLLGRCTIMLLDIMHEPRLSRKRAPAKCL